MTVLKRANIALSRSTLYCVSLLTLSISATAQGPLSTQYPPPPHPYMFNDGANSMHVNSYQTDTHQFKGPEGRGTTIKSFEYSKVMGLCASFLTDSRGHLITVCSKATHIDLFVLDPKTFKVLAKYPLPPRPKTLLAIFTLQMDQLFKDTSGGSYFYLDHEDKIIVPVSSREIWVIEQTYAGSQLTGLKRIQSFDLKSVIKQSHCPTLRDPDYTDPRCDKLTSVLPDFEGRYWFTSRQGIIGTVDRATGEIKTIRLAWEQIQNSFAMSDSGPFIASDHALYSLEATQDGTPLIKWRQAYDRGVRIKPGQINQGTGTTPTLFGPDLVAIGDNADPLMHANIYRRDNGQIVCSVPVFTPGKSACENSFIGHDHTIIVANSYGYKNALKNNDTQGGLARIDVRPDLSGCDVVWNKPINAETATPELSLANGLIYIYTRPKEARLASRHEYALSTVDYHTGELQFSIPTGRGRKFDNAWSTFSFAPDGSAFVGTFGGMLKIADSE